MFVPPLQRKIILHLTHWGWVMHICISELSIIGSDNALLPWWRQAIIWINTGILSIGLLGTNFSEILIKIYIFSLKKCIWKCCQKIGSHFSYPQCLKTSLRGGLFRKVPLYITMREKYNIIVTVAKKASKSRMGDGIMLVLFHPSWVIGITLTIWGWSGFFVLFTNKGVFLSKTLHQCHFPGSLTIVIQVSHEFRIACVYMHINLKCN